MEAINTKKNNAGSYYLAAIGLAVALVGAVFVYLLWNSYSRALATREWNETDCLIIKSKIVERSQQHVTTEYSWDVEYLYDFEGESYSGNLYTLRGSKWNSYQKSAFALMKQYPLDDKAVCFVNPAVPSEAILKHDSKAAGYSIWFPMLFVVGGLGITVSALKGLKMKLNPC